MDNSTVRVRFAPSPTGALHIGGVRTALYNYLFARKHNGQMLLRIEDTDQTRFVPGAEQYILEALNWLNIEIDEGLSMDGKDNGPHGPYRQSERKAIYREYAEKLVAEGKAYYAFDTPEELDAMRKQLEEANVAAAQYNAITRLKMKNSLTLSEEETAQRIANGEPYVIRIKVQPRDEIRFNDLIRGWIVVHSSQIDDKVLMKSDGMPTYHLANIVDDHIMQITHVIRGEEWLPSAPLHVLLYNYLGWEAPQFAHLPLLLKPDGNGKLSKRDADAGGFPIFPLQWTDPRTGETAKGFQQDGYLPDATTNFLAFLGWNPGTEQELFSMEELIEAFSLERVHKAGAKFDIQKAQWFNQQYIRSKSDEELLGLVRAEFEKAGRELDDTAIVKIIHLLKERVTFTNEFVSGACILFSAPESYDETVIAKKWNAEAVNGIQAFITALQAHPEATTADEIKHVLHDCFEQLGIKMGKVMQSLRVALTGAGAGPDLMLIMEILGQEEVINRLEKALQTLPTPA